MTISRISTSLGYSRVLSGLSLNNGRLLDLQTQLTTGLQFQTPSDNPGGVRRVLDLEGRLSNSVRSQEALAAGEVVLGEGASRLLEISGLVAEAREHLIQGLNGVLDDDSRALIGAELRSIRDELLRLANSDIDGNSLFAGSNTGVTPFQLEVSDGVERVVYAGNTEGQAIEVDGIRTPITLSGLDVFAAFEPSGVNLVGTTGLALGSTANEGVGSAELVIRSDGIDASSLAGAGIATAGSPPGTLVGTQAVTIDAVAGTIRLGDGPAVSIPDPTSPEAADFELTGTGGATLRLDLSAYDGSSITGSVTGAASISFDGGAFTELDTTDADLRLIAPDGERVVHVDATQVTSAGRELVHYSGAENLFDLLGSLADDLESSGEFGVEELQERLGVRLSELDRHQDAVGRGLGTLGARTQRLGDSRNSLAAVELNIRERLSEVQDIDISEVVLDLQQTQNALQLSQATGARLLQTSLLDFLR